jgi:protein SCO1/2
MKKIFTALLSILIFICGCESNPPVIGGFGGNKYQLVNQNNGHVIFPDFVKGRIVVMNYIFTNCPDICPLSTNNMRLIQERLNREKIQNVRFVSLSFDPLNDTPEVLSKFARARDLDLSNWDFLTGDKNITDSLIKQVGVIAVPGDSLITSAGKKIYYFIHTDRISLIDTEGRIRKNYKGSAVNIDELTKDIKELE